MRRSKNTNGANSLNGILFEPPSEWKLPTEFPNLRGVSKIGLDLETRDPNLPTRGPGGLRRDGNVVGISIATDDRAWYFPFGHLGGGNMARESVIKYVADVLRVPDRWVLTANGQYELEWLDFEGVEIHSRILDVQVAEALIDEELDDYSLEGIATRYIGKGKDEALLHEALSAYGCNTKNKGDLWKLPARFVGPYAEYDAHCLLAISAKQFDIMKKEDLLGVYELESKLLPILWKMRKRGIRIDVERAARLSLDLAKKEKELRDNFYKQAGWEVDIWSGQDIAKLCDSKKIQYLRTTKGNPSFEGDWLDNQDDPLLGQISELREVSRLKDTFVDKWIFDNLIKDRVHPNWRQTRREDGGTRSGRMAANNPNPQQVPASKRRDGSINEIAILIRSLFIPEDDEHDWFKGDYSQQEPRILTHFAEITNKTGAKMAAMAYRDNPDMDFYNFMVEAANILRRPAKDMYLGRCYGMGIKKMAKKLNRTEDAAREALDNFDNKVPFVKEMADACMSLAERRGWIKTICGRKCHFLFWEPVDSFQMRKDLDRKGVPLDSPERDILKPVRLEEAQKKWPNKKLKRSNTHKALNRLIQGSAADMIKSAMVQAYEDSKWYPYMAVHDELGGPVRKDDKKHKKQLTSYMTDCVKLTVPIGVEVEVGKSWK